MHASGTARWTQKKRTKNYRNTDDHLKPWPLRFLSDEFLVYCALTEEIIFRSILLSFYRLRKFGTFIQVLLALLQLNVKTFRLIWNTSVCFFCHQLVETTTVILRLQFNRGGYQKVRNIKKCTVTCMFTDNGIIAYVKYFISNFLA